MRCPDALFVIVGSAIASATTATITWFYPYWSHRAVFIATDDSKQYNCTGVDFDRCKVIPAHTHQIGEVVVPTIACSVVAFVILFIILGMSWLLFISKRLPADA